MKAPEQIPAVLAVAVVMALFAIIVGGVIATEPVVVVSGIVGVCLFLAGTRGGDL